jgi:hypothetical protein
MLERTTRFAITRFRKRNGWKITSASDTRQA